MEAMIEAVTFKNCCLQGGEMAQRLAARPEVLSLIPGNHMVAHNHLYWDLMHLMPSSGMSEESDSVLLYIK